MPEDFTAIESSGYSVLVPLDPGASALPSARLTVTGDSPSDDIRLTVTGDSPSDDIRVAFCSWIPLARSAVSYLEINV